MKHIEDTIRLLRKLARKTRDAKLRRCYDIVHLSLQGHSTKNIASIMNTGRKKKMTLEQEKIIMPLQYPRFNP